LIAELPAVPILAGILAILLFAGTEKGALGVRLIVTNLL
jgi:hypothetical protein